MKDKLAKIASKLLDKGEIELAREVLAIPGPGPGNNETPPGGGGGGPGGWPGMNAPRSDPKGTSSAITEALADMEEAAKRVIFAMHPVSGTDMDSDVIKQMAQRIHKMISSYVE